MPIGSRVRLASGGPVMIVVDQLDLTTVVTAWEDTSGEQHEHAYPIICLDVVRR